jgi:hypothetical protein
MTRKLIALSLAALFVAGFAAAGDKAWFGGDCAMCANMMSDEALMKNMKWEQYDITAGFVAITTVKGDYIDNYRTAHEGMNKTTMKLQAGEALELCGSCTHLGMCMMKGVSQEYVETSSGDVWIVTSDDPVVVAELHTWVKKNKEEMAKSHQGHEHG